MVDLQTQLRVYVEATVERVDAADVLAARRADVRPLEEGRRRRRLVAITLVAAAATLILVGGAALLTVWLNQDEAPVATSVATTVATTTTVAPTTTVPPTTTTIIPELDPAAAAAWGTSTLILPEEGIPPFSDGGHIINDVAANESLVVAVGDAFSADENAMRDGLVWISADGRSWERVSDPDDFDFGGTGLNTVVAAGPGFVAGGSTCDTEERCTAGWRAGLWTSVDGRDWLRVPHDTALFGERSVIQRLLVRQEQILALGAVCDDESCGGVIWSSPDGRTWERAWTNETMLNSLADGEAGLVAVGSIGSDTGSWGAVWTSTDGTDWQPVPHDPEVFGDGQGTDVFMYDVVAGTDGYVAVGSDGTDAIVWFSADAVTWERISFDTEVFGAASVFGVITWGDGFVAFGPDWAITEEIGGPVPGLPSVPSRPTIWVSSDGRIWHRIGIGEPDAVGAVRGLVSFRGMLIAAGQHGTFLEGQDALWFNEQPPGFDR